MTDDGDKKQLELELLAAAPGSTDWRRKMATVNDDDDTFACFTLDSMGDLWLEFDQPTRRIRIARDKARQVYELLETQFATPQPECPPHLRGFLCRIELEVDLDGVASVDSLQEALTQAMTHGGAARVKLWPASSPRH